MSQDGVMWEGGVAVMGTMRGVGLFECLILCFGASLNNTPRFINLLSHGNEGIMGQYIVPDIDIGRPLFWSKRPIGSAEFGIWLIK